MTAHWLVGRCLKAWPGGGGESWIASTYNAYWSRPRDGFIIETVPGFSWWDAKLFHPTKDPVCAHGQ